MEGLSGPAARLHGPRDSGRGATWGSGLYVPHDIALEEGAWVEAHRLALHKLLIVVQPEWLLRSVPGRDCTNFIRGEQTGTRPCGRVRERF